MKLEIFPDGELDLQYFTDFGLFASSSQGIDPISP